jgi:protein ImuB
MERTLCIWYPDWPLRRPDVPPDRAAQAVGDDNRVVAVNNLASRSGIAVGMRRQEAEAACPAVLTVAVDPGAEATRFEPVAVAIEKLIPRIEIVMPGLVLAPISGAVRYYGGEQALTDRVNDAVEATGGPGFRIGLALGPFAARRAAELATVEEPLYLVEDDTAFLASLDVASVGSEELASTFRWLGVTTLGDLAGLPREAVVSRFGQDGLDAHRLARGEDRSAQPRDIPDDFSVEEKFSPPLENLEQAAFMARSLAHRLLSGLAGYGSSPYRVEVEAESADGELRVRVWRSSDPFDERALAERVRWQLQAWLDHARHRSGPGIRGGLVRLRIAPADISDSGRQLGLHEDARSASAMRDSLARAQSIVGLDGVLQAVPQGGRTPGQQAAWYRWGEDPGTVGRDVTAPWPGKVPTPSPALVPPDPQLIEIDWDEGLPVRVRLGARWVPVLSWAGPWRSVGRWWVGEDPADRYQLVTSVGAFLCEVRAGKAYLTGVYD